VLGAPRSGFLADFQPPGASRSPPGLEVEKQANTTSTKTPTSIYIYIYIGVFVEVYRVSFLVFWCSGYLSGIPSKKWCTPRLSLLK
jgi:hypothetical protein